MEARQSDIRNKIIAPVFKRVGLIDQWGNGLKLISEEIRAYPEIEFMWFEKGLQFQIQFINKAFQLQQELRQELKEEGLYTAVLKILEEKVLSTKDISLHLGQKGISGQLSRVIKKLVKDRLIERTIPDQINHPKQMYKITDKGLIFLKLIAK